MDALTRLRKRFRSDSGAEFVEFALAFPLLLLVVLGIMDFGLLFQQYEVITNAAREGARIAVLPAYSKTDAETRVNDYIGAALLSGGGTASVDVGDPTPVVIGGKCMSTVTVTVTYPHDYLFLGGITTYFGSSAFGTRTLSASSTMRTEIAASGC